MMSSKVVCLEQNSFLHLVTKIISNFLPIKGKSAHTFYGLFGLHQHHLLNFKIITVSLLYIFVVGMQWASKPHTWYPYLTPSISSNC